MIPRYSRPEAANIWTEQSKYDSWLTVELAVCDALAELGQIPASAAADIRAKATFDERRILEIEAEVRHDVIAFLTNVNENVGENARYIHQGMTSSDMLDTAFSWRLTKAVDILINDCEELKEALKEKALKYKMTPCIGRSHGIHAEPTSFGLKMLGFYAEFKRNKERLEAARREIAVCAISGAVGTFATIDPRVEKIVAEKLGLAVEDVSTQVIPRDRYAALFAATALVASSIERLAVEIRHLQRTEVREVEEFFSSKQKGSSAMPHKRNPILSENLTGLARLIRSYVIPAMENVALWHERDISHSSNERIIAPDALIGLDFILARMTRVIKNLLVYPENMEKNLNRLHGLIFSQRIMLALVDKGLTREQAYKIVQSNAMKVWETEADFKTLLEADAAVMEKMTAAELEALFDVSFYLRRMDDIYHKVLG